MIAPELVGSLVIAGIGVVAWSPLAANISNHVTGMLKQDRSKTAKDIASLEAEVNKLREIVVIGEIQK